MCGFLDVKRGLVKSLPYSVGRVMWKSHSSPASVESRYFEEFVVETRDRDNQYQGSFVCPKQWDVVHVNEKFIESTNVPGWIVCARPAYQPQSKRGSHRVRLLTDNRRPARSGLKAGCVIGTEWSKIFHHV